MRLRHNVFFRERTMKRKLIADLGAAAVLEQNSSTIGQRLTTKSTNGIKVISASA